MKDLMTLKFDECGIDLPEPLLSDEKRNEFRSRIEEL